MTGVDIEELLDVDRHNLTFHLRYKRQGLVEFSESITQVIRELPGVSRIKFQS